MSKGTQDRAPRLREADMSLQLKQAVYDRKLLKLQRKLAQIQQAYLFSGLSGVIVFEGVSTLDFQKSEPSYSEDSWEVDYGYQPPTILLKIFDRAPLMDDHHHIPGFYVAVSCMTPVDECLDFHILAMHLV